MDMARSIKPYTAQTEMAATNGAGSIPKPYKHKRKKNQDWRHKPYVYTLQYTQVYT